MAERPDTQEHTRRGIGALRDPPETKAGVNAFAVVAEFERRVAAFTGAPYAVAVDRCRNGLFLCCKYLNVGEVILPARTYCAVPAYVIHAGGSVKFEDREWQGAYQLVPYPIWDAAKRFRRGMFRDLPHPPETSQFAVLSFHAKKHLNIGSGGMILTDDAEAAAWFRRARHDGRDSRPYAEDTVRLLGWGMYMRPDDAARGLMLLDSIGDDLPDLTETYPDLRGFPVFSENGGG